MSKRWVTLLLFTLVFGVASADAQVQQVQQFRQYAAKFVCGRPTDVEAAAFAPGFYYTTINVHNPLRGASVSFKKKFALAHKSAEQPGTVSPFFDASLKEDQTMHIDCRDIWKHMGVNLGTFMEGFAVLELTPTTRELDVVTVITAGPAGAPGGVTTLHTERVPSRITQ
jgi:hypothetical protein